MTPEQEQRLADIEEWYRPLREVRSARSVERVYVEWLCQLVREQAARVAELEESLAQLSTWDIGSMNDYGGNVAWWHDYIRSVVGRMSEVACEALEGR